MKKSLFIILLIVLAPTINAQKKIDVLHYNFQISLNDESDTISGKAYIRVRWMEESDQFSLDLVNAKGGKGMNVFSVVDSTDENKLLFAKHDANQIFIKLPLQQKPGTTKTFIITYKGIPANGLIISKNQFGKRTFFGDNWPNRAHHWLPCVDNPADKASVEFIVTAPGHYQVVANGIQIEETNLPDAKKLTHWKEDVPLPTKVMVIGVADFAVQNAGAVNNCIQVSSWVFPENKAEGFYDYATAKDILAWHINYIGPYAYKKLANVQSKTMFGGMENAGAIFYYEGSVSGHRAEEDLQSHEIVHQWFGNMATEKSFAHLWLSEGFATYLTHVYIESKYGTDSLNKRMKADRETVIDFVKESKRPVVDSASDYMKLLSPNSYQKGSWVLHMLRRELGDSIFKKAIRKYYELYAGSNADTDDLRKVFETVSGKNLNQFFQQWLFTPENLLLNVKWKYDVKQKKIQITVNQLQSKVFSFPLTIRLGNKRFSASQLLNLNVTKKAETFSFPVANTVVMITPDPLTSLLADISISEMK